MLKMLPAPENIDIDSEFACESSWAQAALAGFEKPTRAAKITGLNIFSIEVSNIEIAFEANPDPKVPF